MVGDPQFFFCQIQLDIYIYIYIYLSQASTCPVFHKYKYYLNSAHRTIKFTWKWSYKEVEFLDVKVINDSGKLETDVYIKPTDSHQYLHQASCHPSSCKKGIPYAQALRLRRICSKDTFFDKRTQDLCSFLVERGYKRNFVE